MSNRRKIRESVLQALYATLIGDHSPDHVLQTIIKPEFQKDSSGLDFAERLYLRTLDYRDQADGMIKHHIANWEIDRLAIVDRIIIQMAITELITFEDIPTKVTINEAIEIAKKFSTGKSGRFVNGILDAVLLSLTRDKQLAKSGRGLVDQPGRNPKKVSIPSYSAEHPEEDDISEAGSDMNRTGRNTGQHDRTASKKQRIKRPRRSPRR